MSRFLSFLILDIGVGVQPSVGQGFTGTVFVLIVKLRW